MKTLTTKHDVKIDYQIWWDRVNGNTYYSATVSIKSPNFILEKWHVSSQDGSFYTDQQGVDKVLKACGYKVRKNVKNSSKPYYKIERTFYDGLKQDMHKKTERVI